MNVKHLSGKKNTLKKILEVLFTMEFAISMEKWNGNFNLIWTNCENNNAIFRFCLLLAGVILQAYVYVLYFLFENYPVFFESHNKSI